MNLGDTRIQFTGLLNRDDCTPTLADTFLTQAMQRVSRELRLPAMERLIAFPAAPAITTSLPVPGDLVELIDIFVNTNPATRGTFTALDMKPYRDILTLPTDMQTLYYGRLETNYMLAGWLPAGGIAQILYYGEFSPLVLDTDTNELLTSSADLVIYGALSYGGDWFSHPKADAWEAKYQQLRDQVIALAESVEWSGGPKVISPSHYYEDARNAHLS